MKMDWGADREREFSYCWEKAHKTLGQTDSNLAMGKRSQGKAATPRSARPSPPNTHTQASALTLTPLPSTEGHRLTFLIKDN